jgi:hypothetical protein
MVTPADIPTLSFGSDPLRPSQLIWGVSWPPTSMHTTSRIPARPLLGRATVALLFLGALSCGYTFAAFVARYWRFYHLDTPGSGMGLLLVVLPVITLLTFGTMLLTSRVLLNRGMARDRAIGTGLGAALLFLIALFTLEMRRTAMARSGEGPGAGDLAPFVASLVKRP